MFAGMQPLGRPGKIEEIARMFAFMASEENSFMTGSIVASDGGFRYGQGFNAIPKDSSNALTQ